LAKIAFSNVLAFFSGRLPFSNSLFSFFFFRSSKLHLFEGSAITAYANLRTFVYAVCTQLKREYFKSPVLEMVSSRGLDVH